jgi:hypothetical protein
LDIKIGGVTWINIRGVYFPKELYITSSYYHDIDSTHLVLDKVSYNVCIVNYVDGKEFLPPSNWVISDRLLSAKFIPLTLEKFLKMKAFL